MNQEKIGKFIAECRKKKDLTQAQLAEKLNLSYKTISKWETGRGIPDSSVMLELCNYLGISVNELLSGEHLKEEQYHEKANENIISIAKEADKNKKIKNRIIIVIVSIFICLLFAFIINIAYRNIEANVEYDNRLIECKIEEDNIICAFNGLSIVSLNSQAVNTENVTLIFINGKVPLQNKTRSHFETWDSMAQLNDGKNYRFSSKIVINTKTDIKDCQEKIKVYYTNVSLNKIRKASQAELEEIIEQSNLMAER